MGRVESATFVGRAAELAVLDDALEAAVSGRTTTVLIGADAGVGKSRLLATWNERARARGARVVAGSCLDVGDAGPAFAPVVQALRRLFRSLDAAQVETVLGEDRTAIARLLPELPALDESIAPGDLAFPITQTVLFQRMVEVFDRAARVMPLVLELEDLHWADPSTRAFLAFLVMSLDDARLLVVGTFRRDDLVRDHPLLPSLRQLERNARVVILELPPFDRAEVRQQLTAIVGHPPSEASLQAIYARSEGNALFAEELVAVEDPGTDLPTTIGEALLARSAGLSDGAWAVLRVAAVAGRSTTYSVVSRAGSLDDDRLAEALRETAATNILQAEDAGEQVRFRHALLQEAVYRDTVPGERRRLHAAVAEALASSSPQPVPDAELISELARHWTAAGDDDRAIEASLAAADLAASQSAHAAAFRHFERVIELWDRAPTPPSRDALTGVLLRAAISAYFAGLPRDSMAMGKRALAEMGDASDIGSLVDALTFLWLAADHAGEDQTTEAGLRRLAAVDPDGLRLLQRKSILTARVQIARLDGDFGEAIAATRQIEELADITRDPAELAEIHLTIGWLLLERLDMPGAIRRAELAATHAAEAGDVERALVAQNLLYEAQWTARRYEETLAATRTYRELADRLGVADWERSWGALAEADSLYQLGRLDEALSLVEDVVSDPPSDRALPLLRMLAADIALVRGSFDEARGHLAAAYRDANPDDVEVQHAAGPLIELRLAVAGGQLEDVGPRVADIVPRLASSEPHSTLADWTWDFVAIGLAVRATLVERAVAAGQTDPTAALDDAATLTGYLDNLRARQQEAGMAPSSVHDGDAAMIEGHVARIEHRDDAATWARAADAYPDGSIKWLMARHRQSEAMLAAKAAREDLASILLPAWRRAVEIGARPLAAQLESVARRARIPLREAEAAPAPVVQPVADAVADPGHDALRRRGLSDREIEVLGLVAAGYSNGQIAERLFISAKTASVHVSHILDKLDASGRTEAATIGVRLGLSEVEPPET